MSSPVSVVPCPSLPAAPADGGNATTVVHGQRFGPCMTFDGAESKSPQSCPAVALFDFKEKLDATKWMNMWSFTITPTSDIEQFAMFVRFSRDPETVVVTNSTNSADGFTVSNSNVRQFCIRPVPGF